VGTFDQEWVDREYTGHDFRDDDLSRRYRELARGHILGDTHGLLKLLVSREDHTILGVHVLGTNATEVIHIGQTVMGLGGTIDYLVDAVFNYPTLAESYKVAALDAQNRLMAVERIVR
jgi:NAD(P) transhydrogenase